MISKLFLIPVMLLLVLPMAFGLITYKNLKECVVQNE